MPMRPNTMICAFAAWALLGPTARGEDLSQIPTPRPHGWTTDLTGRLTPGTIAALNALGDQVARHEGAELAVVMTHTTDGRPPRTFATELFNRWGIGSRERENGVLIYVALTSRKAEIVLGHGIDDADRVQISRRIMDQTMLPYFRQGDPDQAVVQAARRCAAELLGVTLAGLDPPIPTPPAPRRAPVRVEEARGIPWTGPLGIGLGLLGAGGAWMSFRHARDARPRHCPQCQGPLAPLTPPKAETYLTETERVERRLGSVRHDVWRCEGCDRTVKRSREAWFSSYSRCPRCQARANHQSDRILRKATHRRSGLKQVVNACKHCSYRVESERIIPRLVASSTTSYGSGSSSGSGSGSSSGFGGGSSSGGGASGGW
ncbi:TPM domain-containing protein [Tautonia sp. JC769]|uniref:TPM domain-containing protein n=1 Tax=Tautonia sp. JC769 TaxID=3232135 RepID=UPI003459FE33